MSAGRSGGEGVEGASEQVEGGNGPVLAHPLAITGQPELAGLGRLPGRARPTKTVPGRHALLVVGPGHAGDAETDVGAG